VLKQSLEKLRFEQSNTVLMLLPRDGVGNSIGWRSPRRKSNDAAPRLVVAVILGKFLAIALVVETENDENMGSNIVDKDAKSNSVEIPAPVVTKKVVAEPFILSRENTNNKVDDTLLPPESTYCKNYYSYIFFRKRILQLETTGSRCNGCVMPDDRGGVPILSN